MLLSCIFNIFSQSLWPLDGVSKSKIMRKYCYGMCFSELSLITITSPRHCQRCKLLLLESKSIVNDI